MVDAALQHRVEQFLYREVRLLSELRLEEWLDLFTDDARYWMPARETVDWQPDAVAADGEMAFFDDDKPFLAARIERLRSSLAHAEQPPSRMRYFVSNVEIEEAGDASSTCAATCSSTSRAWSARKCSMSGAARTGFAPTAIRGASRCARLSSIRR